jgi:hypothetical protein
MVMILKDIQRFHCLESWYLCKMKHFPSTVTYLQLQCIVKFTTSRACIRDIESLLYWIGLW